MTSLQLLELLEERKLINGQVAARLREQVADGRKRTTPQKLVKLLVDKGHLTAVQGRQLLAEVNAASIADRDELGFALIDDEPEATATRTMPPMAPPGGRKIVPELDDRLSGQESVRDAWRVDDTPKPRAPLPLDDLLGDLLNQPLGPPPPAPRRSWWRAFGRRTAPRPAAESWDSPLLLLGGGALVLLVLVGGLLFWRIGRENADDLLAKAADDYRNEAYAQAAEKYAGFLDKFPSHDRASSARVQLALARLRQATSGNAAWPLALKLADEVVPSISGEAEFPAARDELAAILPDIAEGLAQQTRQAVDRAGPTLSPQEAKPLAEEAKRRLEEARQSLDLVERYVLASQRPAQRLRDAELLLATSARDLERTAKLEQTLGAIDEAISQGQPGPAYEAHSRLLRDYPALAANSALDQQVRRLSSLMLSAAKTTRPNRDAAREDDGSPVLAAATPWPVRGGAARAQAGGLFPVLADGTAYGVDAATGKLRWRRYIGAGAPCPPVVVARDGANGALLIDVARNELVCLDAESGKLLWRQALGGRPLAPAVAGTLALAATAEGRTCAFACAGGRLLWETQLPQPLAAAPAADVQRPQAYLVADHSNIYALELATGVCREVAYLGHAPGAVRVAPALVLRYLVVAENHLATASRLHVFASDTVGLEIRLVQQIEMGGWVTTPMVTSGGRLVVATDRGGLYVLEARDQAERPLVLLAQRPPTAEEPLERFVAVGEGRILVADDHLTSFELQAARGRLDPRWVERPGMLALQAPVLSGESVFHAGKRAGRPGASLAALGLAKGGPIDWEVSIDPPAGEPDVDSAGLIALSAGGDVFRTAPEQLSQGHRALAPAASPSAPPAAPTWLAGVVRLKGRLVGVSPSHPQTALAVDLEASPLAARWQTWADVQATTVPAAFQAGLLLPDARGQVHLLSLDGARLAQPFQPSQAAGTRLAWRAPGVAGEAASGFVIADGGRRLFRVVLEAQPQPHLKAAAAVDLVEPLVSGVAIVGRTAYGFDAGGWLRSFSLEGLQPTAAWQLDARALFGPARSGEHVYAATDREELMCLDGQGQLVWKVPLPDGPLAGPPLETPQGVVLVSARGTVWRVSADRGAEQARVDLGQPAASGAVLFGQRWVVAGRDGTLLALAPR